MTRHLSDLLAVLHHLPELPTLRRFDPTRLFDCSVGVKQWWHRVTLSFRGCVWQRSKTFTARFMARSRDDVSLVGNQGTSHCFPVVDIRSQLLPLQSGVLVKPREVYCLFLWSRLLNTGLDSGFMYISFLSPENWHLELKHWQVSVSAGIELCSKTMTLWFK